VRAFLRDGDERIVATARSDVRHALLRERLDKRAAARLIPVIGDVSSAGNARTLAARVREAAGDFDVAIPSLGGWWEGEPLLGVAQSTWEAIMREMLETHVFFAQAFVPQLIRRGGTYLAIGGGAALTPIPNAGLVSIAAAAQVMLTRVLARENAGADVLELVVNGPVRTRDSAPFAGSDWIDADDVARVVTELVRTGATTWPAMRGRRPILTMDRSARSARR